MKQLTCTYIYHQLVCGDSLQEVGERGGRGRGGGMGGGGERERDRKRINLFDKLYKTLNFQHMPFRLWESYYK